VKPIKLGVTQFSFTQEADCCAGGDDLQEIIVDVVDGGGGIFYRIKTEAWAIDDADAIAALLARVQDAVNAAGGVRC